MLITGSHLRLHCGQWCGGGGQSGCQLIAAMLVMLAAGDWLLPAIICTPTPRGGRERDVGRMRRLPGQRNLRAAAMAAPSVQGISILGKLVCMRCQHTRLFGNKGSLSSAESLHEVATDTTYWSLLPLSRITEYAVALSDITM